MGRALNVIGVPTGAATFTAALEGLTALDVQLLRDDPSIPPLYEAGIVYTKEATSKWRNIRDVLATKSGDCEALAPWRAAELRVSGEDPGAQVLVYPSGSSKFHAVVLRGDGSIEDPSVLLGMKAPKNLIENYTWWNREVAPRVFDQQPAPSTDVQVLGFDDDDVACVGLAVDHAPGTEIVTFDVVGTPEGYRGQFRVPLADGRALYGVSSTSGTEDEAERKAAAVLGFVGSVWSDLEALAPGPQAAAAIRLASNQHVQNLAKAAYGKAKSVVRPGSSSGNGDHVRRRPPPSSALLDDVDPLVETPLPSDDQQPLADVDTFLLTPPSGYDAALEPDAPATVNGVWSEYEGAVIGYINAALVSGSRPARRSSGGGRSSSGGRGGGQRSGQQRPAQQQQSAGAGFHTAPPLQSPPPPLSPGGPALAPGGPGYGGGGRGGGQPQGGRAGQQWQQQQQGGRGDQQQRQRDKQRDQQQQGGGGGGDSGGGGGGGGDAPSPGAPQLANPDDFFAAGPGGQMGDDAFYATAQLARQVDAFEGNTPGDGYAGPDAAGDAAADAWSSFGQGMTDQQFADTAAFARDAYQQEAGAE